MGETYFLKGHNMIAQYVVHEQEKRAEARWIGPILKLFDENSILAVNGKEHLAQRKAVLQAINAETLSQYYPTAEKTFMDLVNRWIKASEQGSYLDAQQEFNTLASDLNSRLFFGEHIPQSDLDEIRDLFNPWKAGFSALPIDLPFTAFGKALAAKDKIARTILKEAERRKREGPPSRRDLLQILIETIDPATGEVYTHEKLRGVLPTLLFGALDTTVGAEMYFTILGSEQAENVQKALAQVRKDINSLRVSKGLAPFDSEKDTTLGLNYSELMGIASLKATADEVLRLAVPGTNSARKCVKDMRFKLLDGREFTIKSGANVWISLTCTTWTNPFVQDPTKFDYERHLPPREEQRFLQFGMPWFSFGARVCPGQLFAKIQLYLLVAATAMKQVKFQTIPGKKIQVGWNPALVAEGPAPIQMIPQRV